MGAILQKRMARFGAIEPWLIDQAENKGKSCWEAIRAVGLGFPRWTKDIPTAAVALSRSGQILFKFNPDFFDSKFKTTLGGEREGINYITLVTLHELYHVMLGHIDPERIGDRDRTLWNYAADTVVNELILNKYGWKCFFNELSDFQELWTIDKVIDTFEPPGDDPHPARCKFTVEQIYDILIDQGYVSMGMALDCIFDGDGNGVIDGDAVDAFVDAVASDEKAKEALKELLGNSAGTSEKFSDELDGLNGAVTYGVDWRKVLFDFLSSTLVATEASNWMRMPRKLAYLHPDVVLPGDSDTVARNQKIAVYLDVSSSMDKELIKSLTLLMGQLPRNDAEFLYHIFNYTVAEIQESLLLSGNFRIGGGTSFEAIEESVCAMSEYPDVVLVLTDGEDTTPKVRFPRNWCWVVAGSGATLRNADFGKVVELPH